jgi:hypothetical protein
MHSLLLGHPTPTHTHPHTIGMQAASPGMSRLAARPLARRCAVRCYATANSNSSSNITRRLLVGSGLLASGAAAAAGAARAAEDERHGTVSGSETRGHRHATTLTHAHPFS